MADWVSVQFSCSVMADSLWPQRLQHTRLPCPSTTPRAYSNSCPLSQRCHPTISSSVIAFSSSFWLPSFPASGSFLRSQFFALGGETIGASASPSVLPMNTHDWFPLGLTGLISLPSKGLSAPQFKASILRCSDFFMVQLLHPNMTTGKNIALTRQTFVGKVMSLLFNMLSMLIIAFLPRSKHLLFHGCSHHLQWSGSPGVFHYFCWFPIYLSWSDGTRCHDLSLWMLSFNPAFSLSSFTFIKRLFSSSLLSAIRVVPTAYLRLLIFLLSVLIPACAT